jgi:hypothetical protein
MGYVHAWVMKVLGLILALLLHWPYVLVHGFDLFDLLWDLFRRCLGSSFLPVRVRFGEPSISLLRVSNVPPSSPLPSPSSWPLSLLLSAPRVFGLQDLGWRAKLHVLVSLFRWTRSSFIRFDVCGRGGRGSGAGLVLDGYGLGRGCVLRRSALRLDLDLLSYQ